MVVPWLARMTALLGLYEMPGSADNPAIIAMAKFCGGNIAKTYVHDSIPWCALTVNYCLASSGITGNDSLWALDFRKYGKRLIGPAVGAIATKTRDGGGHVFLVVGRSSDGKIVGRGGNQDNMVCDELFEPSQLAYNWPASFPVPAVGFDNLPVVKPEPATKKIVSISDTKDPISIRTNNPGAMWGGARATKWGATDDLKIGDKQGNHIAVFPTKVQGAAAQFDLWQTSYVDLTLSEAIKKWSGDNSTSDYIAFLTKQTGIGKSDKITAVLLAGPKGLALMKAQARWEAGQPYPMSDDEWAKAQNMVFGIPGPPDVEKPEPAKPKRVPWYKKLGTWITSLGLGGITISGVTLDEKFVYSVCALIGVGMICLLIWVYLIPPRGSLKVKLW